MTNIIHIILSAGIILNSAANFQSAQVKLQVFRNSPPNFDSSIALTEAALNNQRIAMEENGNGSTSLTTRKYFYHNDHLGGTNVVTDESGQQAEYTDYQPFGEVKTDQGTLKSKKKFTGKELDDSTGLYDYGARQYDAKLGRFVSADSIDPKLNNPQTLNRYSYTLNNPLKYIDPTGHIPLDYMTDPFFLAMDWADFEANPSFWSGVGLAVDAVLTAIPYVPALGGVSIRGLSQLSKADDAGRAAKVADKAGEVGKTIAKGEEFVHVAPIGRTDKITKEGLKYEKSTWVTKAKYIEGKTPGEIAKSLYKKELQQDAIDKFKKGYSVFEVSPEAGKPLYKQLTTRPGGVPQWQYSKDIPDKFLKKTKEIKK